MPVKPPSAVRRLDWSRIIFDLERCGLSQRAIGRECGHEDAEAGRVWAHRLKNIPGTQPKFHHGALLLGLWAERMEKTPSEAPKEYA